MINIIGGINKRTKIAVPKKNVRPTSAIKREAIFSIIDNYSKKINFSICNQKNILDLFAGSGSFGLEAISRGASFVYFYEKNTEVIKYLNNNCFKICKSDKFEIKKENILESKFNNIDKEISLVFIDPPYLINPFEKILINLNKSKILSNNALVIIECSNKINLSFPSFFSIYNKKYYGKTKIFFLINKN
tara:strand:- start:777 stop:1346 length:570 start_codon:yes stop_codon:yes gene_type:complete